MPKSKKKNIIKKIFSPIDHTAMFSCLHHFLDEPENEGRSLMVSIMRAHPPSAFLLTPQTIFAWLTAVCLPPALVSCYLPCILLALSAPSLSCACSQAMAAGTIGHSAAFKQQDDFYKTMAGLSTASPYITSHALCTHALLPSRVPPAICVACYQAQTLTPSGCLPPKNRNTNRHVFASRPDLCTNATTKSTESLQRFVASLSRCPCVLCLCHLSMHMSFFLMLLSILFANNTRCHQTFVDILLASTNSEEKKAQRNVSVHGFLLYVSSRRI